jgi:hypothetical protein
LHSDSVVPLSHKRINLIDKLILWPRRLSLLLRAQEPRDELLHALRPHLHLPEPSEIHGHLLGGHGTEIELLVGLLLQLVLRETVAQGVLLQVTEILEGDRGWLECRRDHRGVRQTRTVLLVWLLLLLSLETEPVPDVDARQTLSHSVTSIS